MLHLLQRSVCARRWLPAALFLAIVVTAAPSPAGTLITFDTDAAGNPLPPQPALFADTTALRELYAPVGVHFLGPDTLDGGAILDAASGFGVPALSGLNFFAFNAAATLADGGIPQGPETILFDTPQFYVSFMIAGGNDIVGFAFEIFDENGASLEYRTEIAQDWELVEFQAQGIRKLVLNRIAGGDAFVIEDLYFEEFIAPNVSVPEPSAAALMLCGALPLAWTLSRRRATGARTKTHQNKR